jgi:hypothetical protein
MEYAYNADGWHDFYLAVAGAAAALLGLLFIALSLNLQALKKEPMFRARARESLGGFFNLLILALIILIPGQDRHVLGIDLVAFSMVLVVLSVVLQGETIRRLIARRRARWILRNVPFNLGTVAILVAGASLLIGMAGGLFWLVPTMLIYFVRAALNAWKLIMETAES